MVSKVFVALSLITVAVALAVPAQPPAPGGFGPPTWPPGPPAWASGVPAWASGVPAWASSPYAWAAAPQTWVASPPAWAMGPRAGANPFIPARIASAPWMPKWTACSTIGATCLDCNTKMVCTKMGGIQKACTDTTMPYCNLGECSATPTAGCAPPAVPASQTV